MNWSPLVPELLVSDFQMSISFYVDTLGFYINFERDNPPFAYLSVEDAQIMIQAEQQSERWVTGEMHYPYGRGVNFQIEVESLNPYLSNLKGDNYSLFEEIRTNSYRTGNTTHSQKEFLIQDPDGYLLRFVENIEIH